MADIDDFLDRGRYRGPAYPILSDPRRLRWAREIGIASVAGEQEGKVAAAGYSGASLVGNAPGDANKTLFGSVDHYTDSQRRWRVPLCENRFLDRMNRIDKIRSSPCFPPSRECVAEFMNQSTKVQ